MIEINEKYEEEIKSLIKEFGAHWRRALESTGKDSRHKSRKHLLDYILERTHFLDNIETNLKTRVVCCLKHITEVPHCQNPKCGKPLTKYFIDNVVEKNPHETMFCSHKCVYEARETPDSFICFNKQYPTKESKIEFLRKLISDYPLTYQRVLQGKDYVEVARWIYSAVPKLQEKCYNTATRLYWILNALEDFPTCACEGCNNKIGIGKNVKITLGYPKNCSAKCAANNINTQNHLKDTFRKNFGVDNPSKSRKVLDKINASMIRNGSYGKSSTENEIYRMLCEEFLKENVLRQYSSKEFPYKCDFYIVSSKEYIEYNGTWTHGKHAFDPNNINDIKTLEGWKSKENSKYYKNAINVWTKLDPLKRKIAEDNKITRLEFWSIEDFKEWLRSKSGSLTDRKKEIDNAYSFFSKAEFPYPLVTDRKIELEIKKLTSKQYYSDKLPSAIIRRFCPSIWKCESHGTMSPVAYWEHMKTDFDDFKRLYENRMKYKGKATLDVLREGMNIAKFAIKATYLKPMLAKRLIDTYLSDATEIFNPFNGFSGIMLGSTFGCCKKYIGQDINAEFVAEANNIVSTLKISNATIVKKDVFKDSGEYDCLFCCPPYEDIEKWNFDSTGKSIDRILTCDEWIDTILQRYTCRNYLFVIDKTTKYVDHIVEHLGNKSHMNKNDELVLKF